MKKQPLAWLAVATLTAGTAFAQDNPPPAPPGPPNAPGQPADHQGPPPPPPGDRQAGPEGPGPGHHPDGWRHEGPTDGPDFAEHGRVRRENGSNDQEPMRERRRDQGMLLGVAVEPVPHALADQLSLPDGFGILVNFVVPGSAAADAGVEPDDVLKMLNDQILVNPEQLSTLVHSYADGQEISLTAIRKGKEVKWTVKLKKSALPEGHRFGGPGRDGEERGFPRPGPGGRVDHLMSGANEAREEAAEDGERSGPPGPPPPPVPDIMRELRPELRQLGQAAKQQAVDRLQREADRLAAHVDEITILRERDGASRSTKLDLQDARIVIRDEKGELELKSDAGKRALTAKDPQGKVVFNGPVNTPEERKAVPADILPRLEKLEKDEMPAFPEAPATKGATTPDDTTAATGSAGGEARPATVATF